MVSALWAPGILPGEFGTVASLWLHQRDFSLVEGGILSQQCLCQYGLIAQPTGSLEALVSRFSGLVKLLPLNRQHTWVHPWARHASKKILEHWRIGDAESRLYCLGLCVFHSFVLLLRLCLG